MGYLRLCILVGIDCSYPKSQYTSFLDLWFTSYGILKISASIRAGSQQPLSMQQILPKTPPNCPKLPKSAHRQNFEIPPKIKILVFFKKKNSMYRGGTRACFCRSDFQSKNFSYAIFIAKNRPLYVNFSIPPCGN
jgi:hypothetical protein